jgi:hypothetical protein
MGIPVAWRELDRDAVRETPDGYGVYEFADGSGSRGVETGVVRDAVKEELSYGDAERVRWRSATSREHAERLAEEYG